MVRTAFSAKLKVMRIGAGYATARDFAVALGVSENTYARYERGPNLPKFDLFCKICEKLEVTPNDLLGFGDHFGEAISSIGFSDSDISQLFAKDASGAVEESKTRRSRNSSRIAPPPSKVSKNSQMWQLAEAYTDATKRFYGGSLPIERRAADLFDRLNSDCLPTVAWLLTSTPFLKARPSAQVRVQRAASALIEHINLHREDGEDGEGGEVSKDDQSR